MMGARHSHADREAGQGTRVMFGPAPWMSLPYNINILRTVGDR
jgi:hypothetical protein